MSSAGAALGAPRRRGCRWVNISVGLVVQESFGATFQRMSERFAANATAAAFAVVIAEILLVDAWSAAILASVWAFGSLALLEPTHAYAYMCAAWSASIMLFGGLVDFRGEGQAINAAYISLRIATVMLGVACVLAVEMIFFYRSARGNLVATTRGPVLRSTGGSRDAAEWSRRHRGVVASTPRRHPV